MSRFGVLVSHSVISSDDSSAYRSVCQRPTRHTRSDSRSQNLDTKICPDFITFLNPFQTRCACGMVSTWSGVVAWVPHKVRKCEMNGKSYLSDYSEVVDRMTRPDNHKDHQ